MRTSVVFLTGLLLGAAMATGVAQSNRLAGDNYVNHVGMAVDNFDETYKFYTEKMGFPEGFTVKGPDGKPRLAYVQASKNTFVEIGQAQPNGPKGLNHFGLHVQNLKNVVETLKARGVKVEDVRVRPDDSSVANATDPNGIRIEMFEFGPGSPQGKAIAAWK